MQLYNMKGDAKANGFKVSLISGSDEYETSCILEAMADVSKHGEDITAANVMAQLPENEFAYCPRQVKLTIYNMSNDVVVVQRLTRGYYANAPNFYKEFAKLQPGNEMAVRGDDSMAERQLTRKTLERNTSVFSTTCDHSICWRVLIGGYQPYYATYCKEWANPKEENVSVFVEGTGPDEATLDEPRLVYRVKKAAVTYTTTSKKLSKGHYDIPIYKYAGRPDDFSE